MSKSTARAKRVEKMQSRATFTRDLRLDENRTLKKGESGTVIEATDDYVEIMMDKHHPGLDYWGNVAHVAGPDRSALKFSKRLPLPQIHLSCVAILAFSVITAALIGSAITEELEGSAIFERAICGSYDCLDGDTQSPPHGGIEHGRKDATKGAT